MAENDVARNLRAIEKKYENKGAFTGEVVIYMMARDAAGEIERLEAEVERLRAENDGYKADIEAGNLVRLPGKLIAPYELNDRYWICGWDSERCTLTIQDRALMDEAARAALEGGQHGLDNAGELR